MDVNARNFLKEQINAQLDRSRVSGEPPGGFRALPDIPGGRYISEDFYQLEQEHVWKKSWVIAGHADELPNKGDFILWERLGVPIIIVRDKALKFRAFYNTCMHRGGPLVADSSGNRSHFRCQYHSWLYSLEGELKFIPEEHEFAGICKKDRGLKPVRCETLGNIIFINRDPDAGPLVEALGPMVELLRDIEPDKLKFVKRYSFEWPANWKVVTEAFYESYHVRAIHPNTVNQIQNPVGTVQRLFAGGHSGNVVPHKPSVDEFLVLPPTHPLEEGDEYEINRSATVAYNMFPNFVSPTTRTRIPLMLMWPVSRKRTILEIIYLTLDECNDPEDEALNAMIDMFNGILKEDEANLAWLQRSLESGALSGIPLSYQERSIYHLHEQLDKVIGADRIAASLRIEPRLEKLIEDGRGNLLHAGRER